MTDIARSREHGVDIAGHCSAGRSGRNAIRDESVIDADMVAIKTSNFRGPGLEVGQQLGEQLGSDAANLLHVELGVRERIRCHYCDATGASQGSLQPRCERRSVSRDNCSQGAEGRGAGWIEKCLRQGDACKGSDKEDTLRAIHDLY